MKKEKMRECLYKKYITPTERKGEDYIGVEIEMPVVNMNGKATDFSVTKSVANLFFDTFGFDAVGKDAFGQVYSATDSVTGDNLSFDCSYNNLELSFGKEKTLSEINSRFVRYVEWLNREFGKKGHMLTGMGINPNYKAVRKDFLPVPRYQMLEGFLKRYKDWKVPMYFHPYPDFATYASASQVQLDIERDDLLETIRVFSLLEPVKAVLFANSWMSDEPELLCIRDRFWENSTHGINPHNIGMFDRIPETMEELLDYISRTSIFCTMREGHYIHFKPIPIIDYFDMDHVVGEYYENGVYTPYSFKPERNDIEYLRTYKFTDLTFRGTIEYRSACCQPFSDAMCVAALQVGLANRTAELDEILSKDTSIYHHGYSEVELRHILNLRDWPEFINKKGLRDLCLAVLELAKKGLNEREPNDVRFLDPLFERADTLISPARQMIEGVNAGTPIMDYVRFYGKI
ncbi:MAG: glutamylcysteine synthetase [Eubacterium sp.]|nr:glutamylcysteine synthetase [Eubacterium sp.]